MKQTNSTGFFRLTGAAKAMILIPGLFLFGCGHAVKKPVIPPAPPKTETVTGIPACDTYLARYLACHRAAGTYPTDTLQTHYQVMHDTLLQEAGDPGVRPYLANRCQGLSQQLQDRLQGRPCVSPAALGTPTSH